ncbi:g1488 [Coccomyxa elongata]
MACTPEPALSLPPNVAGPVRGEVLLCVGQLSLEDSTSPTSVAQEYQVRVQWWGDRGPGTLLHLLPGHPQALVHFPVCCSSGAFGQYLVDMEWLTLTLEDHFNGMLGEAAVKVTGLGETAPFSGSVTFVQWLGSREQRRIAKVSIQVLVSFTPLTSHPAPAANASKNGPAEYQPLMQEACKRNSNAAAGHGVSDEAEDSAVDSAEEHVQGKESVSMLEMQSFQEGVGPSGRDADTWQDSSAHQAAATAFGSTLDLEQAADAESELASLPRPGSGGGRMQGSITFTPASRQQEAPEEARPVFSFAPYGHADQALYSRGDFASQLAAGHISASLPRLAEFFPAATPSSPPEAVLSSAASWLLPPSHASQIRPAPVVTGIPVAAMSAAAGGFWGPWNGATHHPSIQPAAAPISGSGPDIDALIQRAERLRAQMTAAVGTAAPLTGSTPSGGLLSVGARLAGASVQAQVGAGGSVAGMDGGLLTGTAPVRPSLAAQAPPRRSEQAVSDRVGRLRSVAQRKQSQSANAGAPAANSGVGGIRMEPVHPSAELPAAVATAPAHAGTSRRARPHTAPALARSGRGAAAGSVSVAAAADGTQKGGVRGTAGQKAAQDETQTAAEASTKEDERPSAAVRHAFEVTVVACNMAAAVTAVLSGGSGGPSACYVCYQFPGEEECLYTNEAILQGGRGTVFEATACHSVVLSAAEQLSAPLLFGTSGLPQDLRFELWVKYKDMPDTLCAASELPSADLVALAASAAEVASTEGPRGALRAASTSVALPLTLSEAIQRRAASSLAEGGSAPSSGTVVLHVRLRYSAAACAGSTGADVSAPVSKSAAADAKEGGRSPAAAAPVTGTHWTVDGAEGDGSAFIDLGRYVEPLAEPIQATIRQEIVRACGLQDAVKAADAWVGGSAALRRAKLTGLYVYARLALLPKQAPQLKLQTKPAGPTFCPEFLTAQETHLSLNNSLIRALATQELRVEVYHTCTRSEAAASKLASGASGAQAGVPQDTLLGTAAAPLTDLLTKPQGICKWLTLRSPQGTAVGAVQIAVRFTHLDGAAVETVPSARSPLEQCPVLARALPAEVPAHALVGSSGFAGQPAAATVYIGDAQLAAEPSLPGRAARSAHFFAVYRLPGMSMLEVTGKGHAQHIPGTISGSTATAAQQVAFNHQRTHWVEACETLAHTLSRSPLLVTVMRQGSARNSAASQQPVPVGTAEVDLSCLLRPRLGAQRPAKRFLRENLVLVNPKSKSLGSISVKVLLDLEPDEAPPTQLHQPTQHSASANPPLNSSSAPPESLLSGPAEAALPAHARQQPAESSLEYFSRMEALVSAPHPATSPMAAPGASSTAEEEVTLTRDDDPTMASTHVQLTGDNADDIIEADDIIARSRRLGAAVGTLGFASSDSFKSSPELSGHLLDWATGGDLTLPVWTPQAGQSESPQQPGAGRSALDAWRAGFGAEEGGEEASPWETGCSDDVALRDWPAILNGRQLDQFWAGHDSDDVMVIGPSGQSSLVDGQASAGSDEDDIDALVERFRLSYSRLPGMSDSNSAGSSIEALGPHLPRSHPPQHGGLSTATGIACELQRSASLVRLSGSPAVSLPDHAAKEQVESPRSEEAQREGDLAETQAALSAGIYASGEETEAGTFEVRLPPAMFEHRQGPDHGLANEAPVIAPASGEACAPGPMNAGLEEGAVLPEPGEGAIAAWECASKDESAEDQAQNKHDAFEGEEEGTPENRGGLADSAYTLRQAVHALSKGSAMVLFAPDAVVRADRIKAACGIASPQPEQALDISAAAGIGGCVKAACGVASSDPDQDPAGSVSTLPTGRARAASGVASTECSGFAAAKPAGTASGSLGPTKELPESSATSTTASDIGVDVKVGQETLDGPPSCFVNTLSLPGLHAEAVRDAEGGQGSAGGALQSPGKEAHAHGRDSQRNGEADTMIATLAVHASGAEGNKAHQQAGEPSKSGLVNAARIQTCSDDEDFAVLDLGGGYCSSSDGSNEGWRPTDDAATTYHAPRGALILSSINADDWMFGLGAMPAQPLPTDAGANASSVAPTAALDSLYAYTTPPEQAAVPDLAPIPHQGAEPNLAPVLDHEPARPRCTFVNVLPGVGAPNEADSSSSFPAAGGPPRLGSTLEVGSSRLGAGVAALGSAARLTISEYFAAAEGFVGEPPGGSPSTARTLSDADLAVSRVTSPQSELVFSAPMVQSSAEEQLPVSSATGDAWPAKLAEGRGGQQCTAADSETPAGGQSATRKGSPDIRAAPVIFLNALPAAAGARIGEDVGDAQSAPSTRAGSPGGDDGLPLSKTSPEGTPGLNDGCGGLSRREQFRLAVAAAQAERQKRHAALSQEEPYPTEGTRACASVQPASERRAAAHDDPRSAAHPEVELHHNSAVDEASRREAHRTTSHSLDDIDGNSCGAGDGHSPVASPHLHESSVTCANGDTSSTAAIAHLADSHEGRDLIAAPSESTVECGVATTAVTAARNAADPEDSCQETRATSTVREIADRPKSGAPGTVAAPAREVADAGALGAASDHGEPPAGAGNATADVLVLMGDAEVLSIADPAPEPSLASSGNVPPEVPAAQEPLVTPHKSGNPQGGPAQGIGLAAQASAESKPPSEQCTEFGSSSQQDLQSAGGTDMVHESGIPGGAPAERTELAAEASAVTAPPSWQCSAFGSASQQELQSPRSAAVVNGGVDDGVEAGVVTPRRQSTQELIARFSAGANLGLPRPVPTSPLKFLRSGAGHPSPQQAAAAPGVDLSSLQAQQNPASPPRPAPGTASASYLANLGPPAGRAIVAPLPRSPITSGVTKQPWSPGQLHGRPVTPRAAPPAALMPGPLLPPRPSAASGGPSAAGSPSGFPGHRLRDLEPQAVVAALRRLWGHAPSEQGQGVNTQPRAPVQRLLFPLAGRAQEPRSGYGGPSFGQQQQDRPSSSQSTASGASAQRSRLDGARTAGGREWERDHIRVDRRERPAPRRGTVDAEAERIAQIMASHRVQPWQPDGFGND